MKLSFKAIAIFGSVPVLILALSVLRKHSIVQVSYSSNPIVIEWEGLQFERIENTLAFSERVRTMGISSNHLSEIQSANLFKSIYNMMIGLNEGSYETYRRFRTPTPSKLNPALFNEKNRPMLMNGAKHLLTSGESVPEDFEEYVKVMTARMNNGHGLTNYWVGVCFTNALITIAETNNLAPNLMLDVRKAERVGLTQPPLFFVPERNAEEILSEGGKLFYATITMVVSHSKPDPPFRIYVRFFWDDKYNCWVPSEYVSAFSPQQTWSMIF